MVIQIKFNPRPDWKICPFFKGNQMDSKLVFLVIPNSEEIKRVRS